MGKEGKNSWETDFVSYLIYSMDSTKLFSFEAKLHTRSPQNLSYPGGVGSLGIFCAELCIYI